MDWELHDGERVVGPCAEQDVVSALAAGRLGPPTVCRLIGDAEWRSLRTHAAFAIAMEQRATRQASQEQPPPVVARLVPARTRSGVVYVGIAIAVGLLCVGGVVRAVSTSHNTPAVASISEPIREPPPHPKPTATAPTISPMEKATADISKVDKLELAVSVALPLMTDTHDEDSAGAGLLAAWSAEHAKWSDFSLPGTRLETTFDEMQKDPDKGRGKRTCVSGEIIEIHATKLGAEGGDTGLLMGAGMRLVRFLSVGSSEGIVRDSRTSFCGVAIGQYDYANSAGGTGHAVEIVGMFKIAQNTRAK
jgi:hypothetical protein